MQCRPANRCSGTSIVNQMGEGIAVQRQHVVPVLGFTGK